MRQPESVVGVGSGAQPPLGSIWQPLSLQRLVRKLQTCSKRLEAEASSCRGSAAETQGRARMAKRTSKATLRENGRLGMTASLQSAPAAAVMTARAAPQNKCAPNDLTSSLTQ